MSGTSRRRVMSFVGRWPVPAAVLAAAVLSVGRAAPAADDAKGALERGGIQRGVAAVLGLPRPDQPRFVVDLAEASELLIYFQSPNAAEVACVRENAQAAGLLGRRVFVDQGDWSSVHLADNLAGAVFVAPSAAVSDKELLRVLHPRGKAILGEREIVKPVPYGIDAWSHPYHGPDNNPQSTDQLARAPYLTQFLAQPRFCPMPEVSVAAGGRVFRAFGHIAHKANQNDLLNTLLCVNAHNGEILWKRDLPEGFMIHRNTMVATPDTLYLADHRSCKLIDAATGEVRDEIVVPAGVSDGPVWKWMALVAGTLYALVGGEEPPITTQRSQTPGLGHWPWGMWEGHDYGNPKKNFGWGRTFLAIDPRSKNICWVHREEEYVDSRGVCMGDSRIYFYCPDKFLGCLDANTGTVRWRNADSDLLGAIGPSGKAQHYVTGYATTAYLKCNERYLFFAGPQRPRFVVARTRDGTLVWQKEHGNFQLVLREDGIYAAGPQQSLFADTGFKLAYDTGEVLATLPMRRACTRATGSVDSVFFRASDGTVRIDTATANAQHIAPMRPPCQDGVIISDGHLYWGPWMCGCQLSLYGHICLAPAGDFVFRPGLTRARREMLADNLSVQPMEVGPGDWPAYQGDNARSGVTRAKIPRRVAQAWAFELPGKAFPTAPVAAGGRVFFGDRHGVIRAVRASDGQLIWQAYTGGAIYFPPAVGGGRVFVGSADGRIYAFEAVSGRPLWTFRAAPAHRWIPVYGQLMSTWPVAGGVIAENGVVYAAAGMAHYDGTHVYALDAASGGVKWYNDTSGATSQKLNSGVSLQGELAIRSGELRFLGGGVHEEARYDLATGRCLNEPASLPQSRFHTAFYAYYPDYGSYVSLDHVLPDGRWLCYDASYEGSVHSDLLLLPPLPPGVQRPVKPLSRWGGQRRRGEAAALWQRTGERFHSFIVAGDVLVAAGHQGLDREHASFLAAIDISNGSDVWRHALPGPVVKAGTAVNGNGQVFVALENGRLLALAGAN